MKQSTLFISLIVAILLACNNSNKLDYNYKTDTETSSTKNNDTVQEEALSGEPGASMYFICYKNDIDSHLQVMVGFDGKSGQAKYIKYKGQNENIPIVFIKENIIVGGAHPNIEKIYYEKYNGKITGTYKLTHSGIWDYIVYTRRKDGKEFSFTSNLDVSSENGNEYRKTPCF